MKSPGVMAAGVVCKTSNWDYLRGSSFPVLMTTPLLYICAVPLVLLDVFASLYHSVCFPLNGIPRVKRSDYLVFDRGRLPYLNAFEKVGCVYCSYANGVLAYVAEVAARTEQHWCPIRHRSTLPRPHSRYERFLPYGDAGAYHTQNESVRRAYHDLERQGARRGSNAARGTTH